MVSHIKTFFLHHQNKVLLLIIICVGISLRLTNIEEVIWQQSGYDESRDMLVAEHIVKYGEMISKGPLAAGGFNWLQNSPVYFYTVAFWWFFTGNPISFMYSWAIVMSATIVIGYFVGKTIWDAKLGLILAALLAVHPELVFESRQLLQPYFLPLFSLFFILSIANFYKKKSVFWFSAAFLFLLIGLHFHYGVLLLLPISAVYLAYVWLNFLGEDPRWRSLFLPLITSALVVGSWVWLTYRNVPFDQIFFLSSNFSRTQIPFITVIQNVVSTFNYNLWRNVAEPSVAFVTVFLYVVGIYWLIKQKKEERKSPRFKSILSIYIVSGSLLFAFLSRGFIADTYLLAVLPFFLVIFAISLRIIFESNKWSGVFVTILLCFGYFLASKSLVQTHIPRVSYIEQHEAIAQIMITDIQLDPNTSLHDFYISEISTNGNLPYDGWGVNAYWYFLEKKSDEKLVYLTDYGVNTSPILNDSISKAFLVCDHRENPSAEIIKKECFDRFIGVRRYIKKSPIQIFKSKEYTVWAFSFHGEQKTYPQNFVYEDLLND